MEKIALLNLEIEGNGSILTHETFDDSGYCFHGILSFS